MKVISLEKGKIKLLKNKVIKKTTIEEVEFLLLANKFIDGLENITIFSKEYKIKTPKLYEYKGGCLVMERCFGENLELILRDKNRHHIGVEILNSLLNFFLKNNIYWQDFAPRNILISENEISIMDFERGISRDCSSISDYFVNNVYEEYAAFLLPEERIINIDKALFIENDYNISIEKIKSKRIRTILKTMGFNDSCNLSDYYLAAKMIIVNETPYKNNYNLMFPLINLEIYMKKYGYEKYAKKIIGGYYDKNK